MSWKALIFYTVDNMYKDVANEFVIPSLHEFNIPYIDTKVRNRVDWKKNIAHKPEVIENALYANPGVDLLYTDVDSRFMAYPELMDTWPADCDIAFHTIDHRQWYGKDTDRKEVFNGTIFLRNNDKIKLLVSIWKERCIANPRVWEPHWFEVAIKEVNPKVFMLPIEYAYINSLPDGSKPRVQVDNPVIVHYQASREYKKEQAEKNRLHRRGVGV